MNRVFNFELILFEGIFIRRYKRFLSDINLNNNIITVHCPNTGSLLSVINQNILSTEQSITTQTTSPPSSPLQSLLESESSKLPSQQQQQQQLCMLSLSNNTNRKYQYTLEMIQVNKTWVGIHSALANKIVLNALRGGLISECQGFSSLSTEFTSKDCKIDFQLIYDNDQNNNHNSETTNTTITTPITTTKSTKSNQKKRKRDEVIHQKQNQMLLEVKSIHLINMLHEYSFDNLDLNERL